MTDSKTEWEYLELQSCAQDLVVRGDTQTTVRAIPNIVNEAGLILRS